MPRPTKEEMSIDALCLSYGIQPPGVYHVTKYLCESVRKEYATVVLPTIKMTLEETIKDKQRARYELLCLMFNNDSDAITKQMVFVQSVVRAPWLWDKISQLLDLVAMYNEEDLGNLYRTILIQSYFTDFPEPGWRLADMNSVGDSTLVYRKREAIKLFGILMWKYCNDREREDINKGVIIR